MKMNYKKKERAISPPLTMNSLGITDIIPIAVQTVAVDIEAEDVLYGILMTIESGTGEFYTFAHICIKPLFVDFSKSNAVITRLANGIHKPEILLE